MAWTYEIDSGHLFNAAGKLAAIGYSGHGVGLNNPKMTNAHALGPLPAGAYSIGDPLDPPDHLGPVAMPLTPEAGNQMFGRSAFFIHGDNAELNHSASDGCVILARGFREQIADSDDRAFIVKATA